MINIVNYPLHKLVGQFIILSLLVVFLSDARAQSSRDKIIERELNCVSNTGQNHLNYTWKEVCYSQSYSDLESDLAGETADNEKKPLKATFELQTGYRNDRTQWSIAGDLAGHSPNILSELTWNNIRSYQIKAKGQIYLGNIVLDGSWAHANVFSGDNQDSDYLDDDRTYEFSRSNNSADKGHMRDISGGFGYMMNVKKILESVPVDEFTLTPLIGFSYNAQYYRMQDGNQTLSQYGFSVPLGPFAGLDSHYDSSWYGPWLGAESRARLEKLSISLRVEYHLMQYYAQADWNLRTVYEHPKSYDHRAHAKGYFLSGNLGYDISDNWQALLGFDIYSFNTYNGTDRVFLSAGGTAETQLNGVDWFSYAINAGLKYSWY